MKDQTLDDLFRGIDRLADAMKNRLLEKDAKGKQGWQSVSPRNAQYKAKKALVRMGEGQLDADIDVANWMAIHFTNTREDGRLSHGD